MQKNITLRQRFSNASEAFEYFYSILKHNGSDFQDTKALFNIGFTIENPLDNEINFDFRNWNKEYAENEWKWYLSGVGNIAKLGKINGSIPKIWMQIADSHGNVNSNYGAHWFEGWGSTQYEYIINELKRDPQSRRASLSVYNANNHDEFGRDTPCTYAVNFMIIDNKLNMSVMMRSNDLWYGFCNDQYCFSMLQKKVAEDTGYQVGEYFHFVNNLHLYNRNIK
jgi:thymidylate synthase